MADDQDALRNLLKQYAIGYAPGSDVPNFFACSTQNSMYPDFSKDLKEFAARKHERYISTETLIEFVKSKWYRIDFFKNPAAMKSICSDSNSLDSPIPWTEQMRNFYKSKRCSCTNTMAMRFSPSERSVWDQYKTAAKTIHDEAKANNKPQYFTDAKRKSSSGDSGARKRRSGVAPAGNGAGAAPAPAPAAAPAPAGDGAGAAPAPAPAAAPAPAVARGFMPTVVEDRDIKLLKPAVEAFVFVDTECTKITGYAAVPIANRAAMEAAELVGLSWATSSRYSLAPKNLSDATFRVFITSKHRDPIFSAFEMAMSNKVIAVGPNKPSGDPIIDQYSIPIECLNVFTQSACMVHSVRAVDTTIQHDLPIAMANFQDVQKLKQVLHYVTQLHEFVSVKTDDDMRTRHETFMKMPDGFPHDQYAMYLKQEHTSFLARCGYDTRKKALTTEESFNERFQLYKELIPDWPAEDQKKYMDARTLILSGCKLLRSDKIEELAAFETHHGKLSDLCASHKMQYLMKNQEAIYNVFKAAETLFMKDQPAPAPVPAPAPAADGDDDDEVQIKSFAIRNREEADLALFIAEEICKLQNASKDVTPDTYYEYVHDIVGTVKRWTEKRKAFSVETLLDDYNFSDVTDVDVRSLYAGVNRGTRPNKGTRFLDFLRIKIDGQIASQKEADRARASKVGRKGKNARFENRGASPQPSSGDGPPSPEASPPPRGRASSRAPSRAGSPADNRDSSCVIVGVVEGKRSRTPSTKYDPATGRAKTPNGGRK